MAVAQQGPQAFGDAEAEALTEVRMLEKGRGDPLMEIGADEEPDNSSQAYRMLTLAGLVALAVLVLAFNQDIGFVSLTIGFAQQVDSHLHLRTKAPPIDHRVVDPK